MAVVAVNPKPEPVGAPAGAIGSEHHARVEPRPIMTTPAVAPAAPLARVPRQAAPSTVIPVPELPMMKDIASSGRLAPVVRTAPPSSPLASAPRFANGTGAVSQTATSQVTPRMSDDTVPNLSIGDRTKPGVALPPAARAVQLPSVKRRLAQRR